MTNYIQHLNAFFSLLQKERRLNPTHISLYMALFACWNYHRFQDPFPLFRERLMQISGIGTKGTYFKCLKQLHEFGYIVYHPSLHKYHRSKVSLVRWTMNPGGNSQLPLFQAGGKGTTGGEKPGIGPSPVPVLTNTDSVPVSDMGQLLFKIDALPVPVSSPFNKQYINSINIACVAPAQNSHLKKDQQKQTSPPQWENVQAYFTNAGFPENEATRFFNHYQANGWKQAGKVPITDWQAAANKWISYSKEIKTNLHANPGNNRASNHLHVQQHKNYSDPL